MKPTKLLLALAVAVLLGTCANKEAQETQSLTNTYWRNTKTGDWLIGFTEKHVIYDNAIWDIVAMTEQGSLEEQPRGIRAFKGLRHRIPLPRQPLRRGVVEERHQGIQRDRRQCGAL